MCLAPCFAGCTEEEYETEVGRVLETLDTGAALTKALEHEARSSKRGARFRTRRRAHKRFEKFRRRCADCRNSRGESDLNAVILQRAAEEKTIAVFPCTAGFWTSRSSCASRSFRANRGRWKRSFAGIGGAGPSPGEKQPEPPMDRIARAIRAARGACGIERAPSLVARWFYSKPREGEIFFREGDWPYRRILRACRKLLAPPGSAPPETAQPNW